LSPRGTLSHGKPMAATDSDVDDKVEVANMVRYRLAANPSAFRIPSNLLEISVVRDFLTASDCEGLIRLIDKERVPSGLLTPTEDPEFRTSETCNLQADHPIVRQVEDKVTKLTGIPYSHGETIQGQRYAIGQQFKAHHDFFYADQPYWPEMERCGGQRTWTAMAFLNTPEGGGQTVFEQADIKVTPRAGNLLIWNNLDGVGVPNPFSMHRAMPVTAGTKYVITKWYRERPWSPTIVPTY
jgi:prolyl 4-hydroxylase